MHSWGINGKTPYFLNPKKGPIFKPFNDENSEYFDKNMKLLLFLTAKRTTTKENKKNV